MLQEAQLQVEPDSRHSNYLAAMLFGLCHQLMLVSNSLADLQLGDVMAEESVDLNIRKFLNIIVIIIALIKINNRLRFYLVESLEDIQLVRLAGIVEAAADMDLDKLKLIKQKSIY